MANPNFSSARLAPYHPGTLILKTRPTIQRFTAAAAERPATARFASAGLSALATLERGGLIRRIVPLSREAERESAPPGPGRFLSAMTASVAAARESDPNAGVCLVEVERDEDVPELQRALANDPEVEFVSRVPVRYLVARSYREPALGGTTVTATPPPASTMWNLAKIRWAAARQLGDFQDAQEIRVAVLDTGIDSAHPDLAPRLRKYVFAHPAIPGVSSDRDVIGHGTHVAGTICALTENGFGINGICECALYVWKIFDDQADYDPFSDSFVYFVDPVMYHRALADCLEEGIDVINLSIGGPGKPDSNEAALFKQLLDNGVIIVAAMGNERQEGSPTSYPAAIPGVIAVGATKLDDTVANFSNRGNHITLCAPGVAIWSTLPTYPGQFGFEAVQGPGGKPVTGQPLRRETDFDAWQGTSMASPHVAAAVALLLANKGKLSPAQAKARLQQTADRVAAMNGQPFTFDYGAGRLNLLSMLS